MKERLINHVSLTRRLRQLLVLLTLLLLPAGMWAEDYPITIAGVQVTDANAENITGGNITGTVSFEYDAEYGTSTLNLEGATINGDIVYTSESESSLLIILNGASTVNRITHTGQAEANLNVYRAETNTVTHSLTVAGNGTDAAISGFTSYCISDNDFYDVELGLYWKPTFTGNVITSFLITTNIFGGTGTESSPYIISTPTQLETFATLYNASELVSDCYVELGDDINCAGLQGFEPIGTPEMPFIGHFDGASHKISNLLYEAGSEDDYAGLFCKVGDNDDDEPAPGYVSNLTLENCTFRNGNMYNGAIAGLLNKGTIDHCTVTSCSILNETSAPSSGGIVGEQSGGSITNCIVSGSTIAATSTTGGLAGGIVAYIMGSATVSECQVTGTDEKPTTITCSSNYYDSGSNYTGGIVGNCSSFNYDVISISNNKVSGNTTISSIDNDGGNNTCAGAIVGNKGNASFSNNYYYYSVTTSTKNGEADAVTRDGYNERGTGTENTVVQGSYDLTDNDGAVLYTKKLTIAHDHIVEYGPAEWHKGFSTDGGVFHLIPGLETTVTLKPDDYYTITATTLSYGTTPTVDDLTPVVEDGVYSYTFTMPDNDATLTPTTDLPGYLGLTVAGVPVTETNASNVMGGEEYASVSYSDGTLTLKGANIAPSSQDIIIIDEGVEALTVHLVGYNQIGAYGQYAFNLKGNTALTFTTSDKMPGSLVSNGNVFKQQPSVTYQNGLALDANNTEIKAETGTMTVTGLTGALSYVNSDNNGSAYMYSSPFPFEATKAEMSYGDAVVVSTPDNTTTTELWTSNIQSANVLKYTLQFDWGTCTNKNVTVQVVGYNQNEQTYDWEADGETYSSAVALSTADADGIIEIPLTKDVTSSQLRLRFSSDKAFSFVALSVGITQIVNYPVVVAGTQVTSKNASNVLSGNNNGRVSYDAENNVLTLNSANLYEEGENIVYSGSANLTIALKGSSYVNSIVYESQETTKPNLTFKKAEGALPGTTLRTPSDFRENFSTVNYEDWLGLNIDDSYGNDVFYDVMSKTPSFTDTWNWLTDRHEVSITSIAEGTVKYSLTYVAENLAEYNKTNETITSEDKITLRGPATIKATVTVGDEVSPEETAYYFGVMPNPLTFVYDGVTAPVFAATLYPEVEGVTFTPTNAPGDFATFSEEGDVTIIGCGSGLAYASLNLPENRTYSVITDSIGFRMNVISPITFAPNKLWATYYSSVKLNVPEGLTAYPVSSVNETTGVVTVPEQGLSYIPANTGVLLNRAEAGATNSYVPTTYTGQTTNITSILQGTSEATSVDDIFEGYTDGSTVYVLYNDAFVKTTSGTIPANRGFLVFGDELNAPRLTIEIEGDATGIDTVHGSEVMDNDYYDLSGRKLSGKPTKSGLYIKNGTKVLVK